ncbi:hypothetical protein SAY87_018737 [Trapa incisa]|uniref:Uncharacterized protein n=1 Tax=Trapa incisa TaxID=236973 RepID=A0AAN7K0D9_9MYRT|nr:hypothetical protein SAY87_018737 [Trapa incisa]
MWDSGSHYLRQISQSPTPGRRAPSAPFAYDQIILSPRTRFPHLLRGSTVDPSIQIPQPMSPRRSYSAYANTSCGSPVYAFPYRPPAVNPLSPLGGGISIYSPRARASSPLGGVHPRHLSVGRCFGLVPETPRTRAAEEELAAKHWWPSTVEVVGSSWNMGCGEGSRTRGIGPGPADEEAQLRMERFKIRTVDIDEVVVQDEGRK